MNAPRKRPDPFAPDTPGRKCSACGRGGSVSRYVGHWLHLRCLLRMKREGTWNATPPARPPRT